MATKIWSVLSHPAVGCGLDDSWLANFFNFRTPSIASTLFRAVQELLPGEMLTVTRGDQQLVRIPSNMGRRQVRFSRTGDYVERLDEIVSRAVARQVEDRKDIGSMLSGGLDSVPAAWWMYRQQGSEGRLAAYSWSLPGFLEADETALINQSAESIGIPLHLVAGKDMLDSATTVESDIMLIMQCVYYEMWLDCYFR